MVILGGLEFVIGGYLIHRHQKNKHQKKKLEEEHGRRAVQNFRRQQSDPVPGSFTAPKPYHCPPSPNHCRPRRRDCYVAYTRVQTYPGPTPHMSPLQTGQQTDFLTASSPHSPLPSPSLSPFQQHQQHPPHPPIRRRPVPQPRLQTQNTFQPAIHPLQRHDSFSSLSQIPVANGSLEAPSPAPLSHLQVPSTYPYYNAGFSTSMPSFGASGGYSPQSPGLRVGEYSVDDNLEIYVQGDLRVDGRREEPSEDGEDDPPPPYQP